MVNKPIQRPLVIVVLIFVIITGIILAASGLLRQWSVDPTILLLGNLVLFGATVFSFFLFRRGLRGNNPHVFVRMTYSGMLLRMGICIAAVMGYAWSTGGKVNKIAVLSCFFFYFVYTFAEVNLLIRLSKQQKNA